MSQPNDSHSCCKKKFFVSHESPLFWNARLWFKLLAIGFFCGFLYFHLRPMVRSLQASFFLLQVMRYPQSIQVPSLLRQETLFSSHWAPCCPSLRLQFRAYSPRILFQRWSYTSLPLFLQNFPYLESIYHTT